MATQNDLQETETIIDGLEANKVATLSYTQAAYNADTVTGVSSFNVLQEQNIPNAASTELNPSILAKGFRAESSSIPRDTLNHFWGRTSYNLNKLVAQNKKLLTIIQKAFASNNFEYDADAAYETGNVCYTIDNDLMTLYYRHSSSPTTITGIVPTNTTHWAVLLTSAEAELYDNFNTLDAKVEALKTMINMLDINLDGLDTTEPVDDGLGTITIPAGGTVEVDGTVLLVAATITLTKPDPNIAYWVAVDDNGDGTVNAQLVTRPGAWDPVKQGNYLLSGERTLNWVSLGELDTLVETPVFSQNTKGKWEIILPVGWYYVMLASGLGGGNGGNGTNGGAVGGGGVANLSKTFNKPYFHNGKNKIVIRIGGTGWNGGTGGQRYGTGYGGTGGGGASGGGEETTFNDISSGVQPGGNGGNGGASTPVTTYGGGGGGGVLGGLGQNGGANGGGGIPGNGGNLLSDTAWGGPGGGNNCIYGGTRGHRYSVTSYGSNQYIECWGGNGGCIGMGRTSMVGGNGGTPTNPNGGQIAGGGGGGGQGADGKWRQDGDIGGYCNVYPLAD